MVAAAEVGIGAAAYEAGILTTIAEATGITLAIKGIKGWIGRTRDKINDYKGQTTAGTPNPKEPKKDDEDKNDKENKDNKEDKKKTSASRMEKQVKKGGAPKNVKRVDSAKNSNEKDHIHFRGSKNVALNSDGTIRHGTIGDLRKVITNEVKEWIINNGWRLPDGL